MMERKEIVTYEQLLTVTKPLGLLEPMVSLEDYAIDIRPKSAEMTPYTGDSIFVRQSVAEKLQRINKKLAARNFAIVVTFGYRHMNIQQKYFDARLNQIRAETSMSSEISTDTLYSLVHNFVAVPSVSGHPTGGAVDLTLRSKGFDLDMGTGIADFSNPSKLPTFSKEITSEQLANRIILRNEMLNENFAPFNGEWWHFSFGDKEWAYWYKRTPMYSQIDFTFKNVGL